MLETTPNRNSVVIVNLHENDSIIRKSMSAESVIMNPSQLIIALRAQGEILQVCALLALKIIC